MRPREPDGAEYDPCPPGVYIATCYAMYDLGTKFNEFSGRDRRECAIMWELDGITITRKDKDGKDEESPRSITGWYTLSLHEKAKLRQHLEAWRGRAFTGEELQGFEMYNLLGKPCQIQVLHKKKQNGGVKAEISAIMPLPKGMPAPELVNELKFFSFDKEDAERSMDIEDVTEGMKRLIKKSQEWESIDITGDIGDNVGGDDEDEDAPF